MTAQTNLTQQNAAIWITGLTKSYGKVQALHGIDLVVQQGEIVGFLGPNGAGKTTTIRCLLDMIRPDGGTARVLGFDPQEHPLEVQQRTGYLPGETQFFDNLTAGKQLRYFSDLRGGSVDWKFALELAERFELDLKQPIKNLSKGNKQKVGVIQAFMHHPSLLLLDEPTSGLDPLMQQEVLKLIREANQVGATVFFSSHIMSEVERIARKVIIIREGRIVEVAGTSTLTQRALRNLTVRFKQPINGTQLDSLPGVEILARTDGNTVTLQVTGDMENLLKALARLPVYDLDVEHPSLEEVFLAYYKEPIN